MSSSPVGRSTIISFIVSLAVTRARPRGARGRHAYAIDQFTVSHS